MHEKTRYLKRYTQLPIAFDLLKRQQISLITPDAWEDRNDAYFLERYKDELEIGSVFATCFTRAPERRHHWRSFADGYSGVCLEFDAAKLVGSLRHEGWDVICRDVEYVDLKDARTKLSANLESWPFAKRSAYRDEAEFRIMATSKPEYDTRLIYLPFDIAALRGIIMTPCLPEGLWPATREALQRLTEDAGPVIKRSHILDSAVWRKAI